MKYLALLILISLSACQGTTTTYKDPDSGFVFTSEQGKESVVYSFTLDQTVLLSTDNVKSFTVTDTTKVNVITDFMSVTQTYTGTGSGTFLTNLGNYAKVYYNSKVCTFNKSSSTYTNSNTCSSATTTSGTIKVELIH